MGYDNFIQSKRHSVQDFGIKLNWLPDEMFDYQKHVSEVGVKKGRFAEFLDTGLGKTVIELTIAKNYLHHTNKPVLIITPLAVAFQFIKDAAKHVHPLQLDVIDRVIDLWSNPGEVVLTPFMGVGSEVYSPVSLGRKAIGIELKDSYFRQAIQNLETASSRFRKAEQLSLI